MRVLSHCSSVPARPRRFLVASCRSVATGARNVIQGPHAALVVSTDESQILAAPQAPQSAPKSIGCRQAAGHELARQWRLGRCESEYLAHAEHAAGWDRLDERVIQPLVALEAPPLEELYPGRE